METLSLAAQLVAAMMLVTLAWLSMRAFKRNPGWGIAVLLLSPFAATAFGAKYWRNEKGPFLAYISTFSVTIILAGWLFIAWGGAELLNSIYLLQQARQSNPVSDTSPFRKTSLVVEQHADSGMHDSMAMKVSQPEQLTKASPAAGPVRKVTASNAKPRRTRLEFVPVKVADAKNYIGATVKVTRKNVKEKEYRLTGASPIHLELAQRTSGGTFSFHYQNSDIEKIRILMKQPY